MNKSYNPFKMWGSWTGAIIVFFIFYKILGLISFECFLEKCGFGFISIPWRFDAMMILISLTSGFLIGWGIHSLIRKLRN